MTTEKKSRSFRILLADDGSEHARAAVMLLASLPLPPRSSVLVLRVFTPLQSSQVSDMEVALEHTRAFLTEKGLQAQAELVLGYPGEKIVEFAEARRPHLLILGAKGLRHTLGILLGGVAQQVVEYTDSPAMIVRAPLRGLRRVLLVSDGSQDSQWAARYLARFPLPTEAQVSVMHVLPPIPAPIAIEPYLPGTEFVPPPALEMDPARLEAEERHGQAVLERTRQNLGRYGLRAESILARGDAATEIIERVKTDEFDLILAGARGQSSVRDWRLGSVARKLVHYSNCSVLIVKGRPLEKPRR